MDRKLRIGVITASTRKNRLGEKVARWFVGLAGERPEFEIVPIDLRDHPLPFYEEPVPARVAETRYERPEQKAWVELVSSLDGYVVVTPEYNHAPPAALKNALDHVYAGWNGKPVAFVSYGGVSGGIRSVEQLRQIAIELQMAPIRDEVNIPLVFVQFDEAGKPNHPFVLGRATQLLDALGWWARALAEARARGPIPQPKPMAPPPPKS